MARVIITIEDLPDGKVKVEANPNFMTMMQMKESGHEWTSAQGYALRMLNEAGKVSKGQSQNKIIVPRIGR